MAVWHKVYFLNFGRGSGDPTQNIKFVGHHTKNVGKH